MPAQESQKNPVISFPQTTVVSPEFCQQSKALAELDNDPIIIIVKCIPLETESQ